MLRVTVRIAREGVYPYDRSEFGDDLNESLAGKQTIRLKISASEFTPESLATLEGKPVIIGTPGADSQHVWQDARITPENTVGSVAGTPRREGDDIIADFIITDADTIEKIKNGELCEVSAAYRSVIDEAAPAFSTNNRSTARSVNCATTMFSYSPKAGADAGRMSAF